MELKFADNLTPDQLMIEDLIMVEDEVVEVIGIASDENARKLWRVRLKARTSGRERTNKSH
jgi:hypothetical protein